MGNSQGSSSSEQGKDGRASSASASGSSSSLSPSEYVCEYKRNFDMNKIEAQEEEEQEEQEKEKEQKQDIEKITTTTTTTETKTETETKVMKNKKKIIFGYYEDSKKKQGEDQAAYLSWEHEPKDRVHVWCIFDGHGGYQCALYSSQHFLPFLKEYHKNACQSIRNNNNNNNINTTDNNNNNPNDTNNTNNNNNNNCNWNRILYDAFTQFDQHLQSLNIRGGCTALCVLYLVAQRRFIIANIGDARAIYTRNNGKDVYQLSFDHTPVNEYDRIVKESRIKFETEKDSAFSKYFRIPTKKELGLTSDTDDENNNNNNNNTTTANTNESATVKPATQGLAPVISNTKVSKSKLLLTIGVSRAFGDHKLSVNAVREIKIKPFILSEPYISILDLDSSSTTTTTTRNNESGSIQAKDFLIMACDGPFDVISNEEMRSAFVEWMNTNISSEQDMSITEKWNHGCQTLCELAYKKGTIDDVTIFVIPLGQFIENTISTQS